MRVLVADGSSGGRTAGLAERIGADLAVHGLDVDVAAVSSAPPPSGYDAVVVAGVPDPHRWPHRARHYVRHHAHELRSQPVWLVTDGGRDDGLCVRVHARVSRLARLGARVGARGIVPLGRTRAEALVTPVGRPPTGGRPTHDHVADFASAVAATLGSLSGAA